MVFVANKPVGNLTAFDMPLVCTHIFLSCVHFVAMSRGFVVLFEAKEVAINLMTCLRLALYPFQFWLLVLLQNTSLYPFSYLSSNFHSYSGYNSHPLLYILFPLGVGSEMSEYNTPWA
jgi:hypothetical protein